VFALTQWPGIAQADLITIAPGAATVIDFNQFGSGYHFTFGPAQIGDAVSLNVTFTGTPQGGGNTGQGSLLGSGPYGLASNGDWDTNKIFSGLDSSRGAMTYFFNFGLIAAVGGFMNYAPDNGEVSIEALDAAGHVLESHLLGTVAPIFTPGQINDGAFRGISRPVSDIAAFRVSNGYAVLDDLTFSTSPQVPEPLTIWLLGTGVLAIARRRMQSKR
jgi:hypothetical protein